MELAEGKKEELRNKLKSACERYAQVFKQELSVAEVLEKLEELKLEERKKHFIQRLGPVTELDCVYLIQFMKGEQHRLNVEARIKEEVEADGKDLEHSAAASEERQEDAGRGKRAKK